MFHLIAAVACFATGSLFVTVFGITGITLPILAACQTAVNPVSVSVPSSVSYSPTSKHWAYGSAGTILGFWLKN
jgi:hypothetical protein